MSVSSPPSPALREPREPAQSRLPLAAEALGYLGAAVALVAGLIAARQLWPRVPAVAELAFAGTGAVALLAAGLAIRADRQPALARLRSAVWLASAVSAACFAGLLTGPQFWDLGRVGAPLVTEAAVAAYAAALWWRTRSALSHVAAFAAVAALTGTAIALPWPGGPQWGPGAGIWAMALLWGIAAHRGRLAPQAAGYAVAAVGLLAGAQLAIDAAAGQVLAVGTVAGLLAAGVAARRVLLLGLGALGAAVLIPQVAVRYLPGAGGAAAAVCAVGLVMLGAAIWLSRHRRRPARNMP
jgi:hypothetical protein